MTRRTGPLPSTSKGFTLTELMMVVGITSVLVAVSVPTYLHYQCSSHIVEAKQLARAIYNAEMAYYSSNLTFTGLGKLGLGLPVTGCIELEGGKTLCSATPCDVIYGGAFYDIAMFDPDDITDCQYQAFNISLSATGLARRKYGAFRIGYYGKGDARNGDLVQWRDACP